MIIPDFIHKYKNFAIETSKNKLHVEMMDFYTLFGGHRTSYKPVR